MKRWKAFALMLLYVLCLAGCMQDETTDLIKLDEVIALVSEKGYTEKDINEKLAGRFNEDIIRLWGTPDFDISGFGSQYGHPGWAQGWYLDEDHDQRITLYLDEKGYVEEILVDINE